MIIQKNKQIYFIFIIVVLGLFAYFNSLRGEFILDDKALVECNTYIKDITKIPSIFSQDLGSGASCRYHSYRPLQLLSYSIDFSIWKLDVFGYHLVNVLLNVLVALCIYWLTIVIFNNKIISFFTSLLFVLHPVHTGVVSYISSRSDLLSSLFLLLGLIFYIKQKDKENLIYILLVVINYIFALLSKENALTLPLIIILYHFIFKNRFRQKSFSLILVVTLIYILVRTTILKNIFYINPHQTNLWQRIPGFFAAVYNYISILILPVNLHMEYGNNIFKINDFRVIFGFVATILLLMYAFKKTKSDRIISFSIFWFFVGLILVSNIYPLNAYMAENWVYLPSLGFCLLTANFINLLYSKNKFKIYSLLFILVIIFSYTYLTIKQNKFWKNNIAFYENTLKYNSSSARIYNNLAAVYLEKANNHKAIELFKKAIVLEPYFAAAYCGLGNAYKNIGQNQKALDSYIKAIELNPYYEYAYNVLGMFYASCGDIKAANLCYKKALSLNPNYKDAQDNLNKLYFKK